MKKKENNTDNTGNVVFSAPDFTFGNEGCVGLDCSGSHGYVESEQCECDDCDCDELELSTTDMLKLLLDDHTEIMNRLEKIEEQLKKIKKKI